MGTKAWHYYESHVTVEGCRGQLLFTLQGICGAQGFRLAVLDYGSLGPHGDRPNRLIATARHGSLAQLMERQRALVWECHRAGLTVLRYKIESTLIDSKHEPLSDYPKDEI